MTNKSIAILTVATVLFAASTAKAQVSKAGFVHDEAAFADHVVNDLLASFDGQYTGVQLIVELSAGSIYQDAAGGKVPPVGAVVSVIPSLGFDTFVAQGSAVAGGADGEPSPGGGAVDLGGNSGAVFSDAAINQAWNPAGGQVISDQSDFMLARVTLSNDAQGIAHWLVSAAGQPSTVRDVHICDGFISCIPEPTTMMLATFGLIGVVASRRRSDPRPEVIGGVKLALA